MATHSSQDGSSSRTPSSSPAVEDFKKRPRPRRRLLVILSLYFLLFTLIALGTSWYLSTVNTRKYIEELGNDYAKLARQSVLEDLKSLNVEKLLASEQSEAYGAMRSKLRAQSANFGFRSLSIFEVDENNQERTYWFTVATNDQQDKYLAEHHSFGTVTSNDLTSNVLKAAQGEEPQDRDEINNEYGHSYSWFFPLLKRDSGRYLILGVDYEVSVLTELADLTVREALTPLFVIILMTLAILLIFIYRRIVRPVREVAERMSVFVSDRDRPHEPLRIASGDEIQEIADSFTKMEKDIDGYIADLQVMTAERVTIETEMEVARHIQVGMVPPTRHLEGLGWEIVASARSARAVGGDFYDCFVLEDGRVCAVIADVSGKGVSAALFMAMCKARLNGSLRKDGNPAAALNQVNADLMAENPEGMFVTAFACVFDAATGVLEYANAGHNPPLLVADREVRRLDVDPGIALGLIDEAGIVGKSMKLVGGNGVLLYTDGATDAVNSHQELFGMERLVQVAEGAENASGLVRSVSDAVTAFEEGCEPFDDLTLLALFALPRIAQGTLPVSLDSFARLRDAVLEFVGETPASLKAILACDEAFSNVVNYSGACEISYAVELTDDGSLAVTLSDDGVAFDPLSYHSGERSPEEYEFGGMGISFIRQICADMSYERREGKNILTLCFAC